MHVYLGATNYYLLQLGWMGGHMDENQQSSRRGSLSLTVHGSAVQIETSHASASIYNNAQLFLYRICRLSRCVPLDDVWGLHADRIALHDGIFAWTHQPSDSLAS